MATVKLKVAASFFHAGVKYMNGVETKVMDDIAKELSEFPQYFDVKFEDKPAKPSKVTVVKKGGDAVQSIAQTDEPAEAF